ncbi:MAG: glycosyltransferase family 4 protein [Acidimicrobiia bacterium]|nr:glycosyltransferase family 4 protein [Acidimicrobiia bacterium]
MTHPASRPATSTPRTLLVTNDFPPEVGGIQVVQGALFGFLDPERLWVLASAHPDAAAYDAAQPWSTTRVSSRILLPTPAVRHRLEHLVERVRPDVVIFGSALPLGLLGDIPRRRGIPHVVFVYGAEVPVAARLPVSRRLLAHVLGECSGTVAMGPWVAAQAQAVARRPDMDICCVYPGVDTARFTPGPAKPARQALGLDPDRPTVTSISRLVPRKGMHLLLDAVRALRQDVPTLQVGIAGSGREHHRLARLVESHRLTGTVTMLGRVPNALVPDVHRAADVATMLCHTRWVGLEQEGFGIVFVEAGACGRPVVAGRSGGSVDAVADGVTGTLVDGTDTAVVAGALRDYLLDPDLAGSVGAAGRERAETIFSWEHQGRVFADWLSDRFA